MPNTLESQKKNLQWNEKNSKVLCKTAIGELCTITSQSPEGSTGNFITLRTPDWVIVIPEIENENCFLMVDQWRHGSKTISREFPGGVIEQNENPEVGACRELREETGYISNNIVLLGNVNPNPAFMTNTVYIYFATELINTGSQELDKDEFVDCIKVQRKTVIENMGKEPFTHGIMSIAMNMYRQYKDKKN